MMPEETARLIPAVLFATAFVCLYVGHMIGDHWVQTSGQARTKGGQGRDAVLACVGHVSTLTLTKVAVLVPALLFLGLPVSWGGVVLALVVDATTHYLIDRRPNLAAAAEYAGRGEFYRFGTGTVDEHGRPAPHLGTGAHALDQSAHIAFLFLAALIIAGVSA